MPNQSCVRNLLVECMVVLHDQSRRDAFFVPCVCPSDKGSWRWISSAVPKHVIVSESYGWEEAKRLLYFSIRGSVRSELLPRYREELLGKSESTFPYAPPFALTSLRSTIMGDVLLEGVIRFQDQIRRLATLSQVVRSDRNAVSVVRGDGKPAHSNDDQEETNKARACGGPHEMLFPVSVCSFIDDQNSPRAFDHDNSGWQSQHTPSASSS